MDSHQPTDCSSCSNYTELLNQTIFFKNISQEIMEKKPIESLLKDIIDGSKRLLNAEASSLLLYDKESNRLYFTIAEGGVGKMLKSNYVEMGQGFAGWVAENKETLKVDDCYSDSRFNPSFDKKTGFKTKNMLCTPMIRKGELIGVIQVINKIGSDSFNDQDISFFTALAAQCAIAIENSRLVQIELESEQFNTELNTARKIQQKTLPSELPEVKNADVEFCLIPAKHLGGDYYNLIRVNDSCCLIMIADVSGKSVSASLIVASVYSFLQTYLIVNKAQFDLKDFVESLNKFLTASTTSDKFVTAWFGLIDEESNKLHSISAGHDPTYFYESGTTSPRTIDKGGLILGLMNGSYEVETFEVKKGDIFVVYTDGVTEAMNNGGEEYGKEKFQSIIESNLSKSPTQLLDAILNDVKLHRGNAAQSDDITMGVIKFK